jgi:sugar O-acyltransferase (sialic acid O-acetyltransferase NeuD family)
MKKKKLIIFGIEDYAHIVYEYFTHDSEYEVVAFTVDRQYIKESSLFGLPVIPFEEIEQHFAPESHAMHVAVVYGNLNRLRAAVCARAKAKGYALASYISSRAFCWHNAKIGEHCFIFEDNTIQPFVTIGNNAILWSGNHIGHHSKIGNDVFITSHVVVSGWCIIADNTFLGVNATLANNTTIGKESWIMHGAIIGGTVPPNSMVKTAPSAIEPLKEEALFRALARAAANRERE